MWGKILTLFVWECLILCYNNTYERSVFLMSYFTLNNLWVLIRQLADIACVWALVYYCLKIVKNNSRTIQIFKGILLVIIVKAIATYLE